MAAATAAGTAPWVAAPACLTGRDAHTMTLLSDGRVLLTGGSNTAGVALDASELFDPASGRWTAAAALP